MFKNIEELTGEVFLSIPEFTDYFVSNLGRVVSTKKSQPSLLNGSMKGNNGYLQVGLYRNGKLHIREVHRIVAELFLSDFSPNKKVDHKNRDKRDNSIHNLRMTTQAQNRRNSKPNKGRKFKGVYKDKNKYFAKIRNNGSLINLGSFCSEREGAIAYDKALWEIDPIHGVFNFPELVNKWEEV